MRWTILLLLAIGCLTTILFISRREVVPQPTVASASGRVEMARCVDCHEEICNSFFEAPHHITLRPSNDPQIVKRFAGRQVSLLEDTFRFESDQGRLRFYSARTRQNLPVDWVLGSGHHALTPVSILQDSRGQTALVQLHVTWFSDDTLDLTPGSDNTLGVVTPLGLYHSHAETRHCFGCHASSVPVTEGKIDFSQLQAGVTCARCHTGLAEHLESDGDQPTSLDWPSLSPRAAINLCGECHRRSDEFTADELVTENQLLLRFGPVGISQSPCFQTPMAPGPDGKPRQLDCLACHDPHSPAQTDPWFYVGRCLTCHGSKQHDAPDCRTQPMNSQCLECHMPKVQVMEHLTFTDHWIRVRQEESVSQ